MGAGRESQNSVSNFVQSKLTKQKSPKVTRQWFLTKFLRISVLLAFLTQNVKSRAAKTEGEKQLLSGIQH